MAQGALGRARGLVRQAGFDVVRYRRPDPLAPPVDCDAFTAGLIEQVRPYTLTSAERIMALVEAVRYVVRAEIPGAFVECGVWRGGSAMVVAHTLLDLDVADRDLFLYDTFTHMPDPGEHDTDHRGVPAEEILEVAVEAEAFRYLPFDEVRAALVGTGYPEPRLHLVQGMVEDTIPDQAPDAIALCRLDTDWYESTAHELAHLYPRLASGGVLLVDDYGHFMGAKKAVDEHLAAHDIRTMLHRIDFTGRLLVKP